MSGESTNQGRSRQIWPRRDQAGFTLIESLACIVLIGILVGLLVPAIQAARESSRRMSCMNNLKQIGIAIHAYASINQSFPPMSPRGFDSISGKANAPFKYSPFARMLPGMEQTALFNSINFDVSPVFAGEELNATAMLTVLNTFLCPSDMTVKVPGHARINYRFNIGPTPWHFPVDDDAPSRSGPFTFWATYRPGDFRDGLSNTLGFSERLQGDWTKGTFHLGGDYRTADDNSLAPHGGDYAAKAVAYCSSLEGSEVPVESRGGETWMISGLHFTAYNHCTGPNSRIPDCTIVTPFNSLHDRTLRSGVMSASSGHVGGVNATLMDGSVRFLRDSIELSVWRALATRSNGDLVRFD